MDVFGLFFLSCISILFGIIITLVVQYYILYAFLKKSPIAKAPDKADKLEYTMPDALKKQIESENLNNSKNCSVPVSLILQFLFHELRHSESIKCWLFKKLSLEFDELLNKTTIGKFFDSINIKDMHLGDQFPHINGINIEEVKLDKKEGHIEILNLCLNIEYAGNFLLCVDGKMKFGKAAFLSIKVKKLSGSVRLQFTRIPYTHWSFSFHNDPLIDLAVESHFQGRQLQSNITNLIVNQIKKAIRRKHTLPNYKIRYKPFFVKTDPSQLDSDDGEIIPQGQLELNCVEISRLAVPQGLQTVHYTLAIDNIPWICAYQKGDSLYITLEIILTQIRQTPLGVVFKQEQGQVVVDTISTHSLAFKSGLKTGDVVLMVENKNTSTVSQVAKALKSTSSTNVTLRIERIAENYSIKCTELTNGKTENAIKVSNEETSEEEILTQNEQDCHNSDVINKKDSCDRRMKFIGGSGTKSSDKSLKSGGSSENISKFAQTIGNFSLRKRKASVSEKTSNENSAKTTPSSSNPTTPQHSSLKQTMTVPVASKKHSMSEIPEIVKGTDDEQATPISCVEIFKSNSMTPPSSLLSLNNEYSFSLKDNSKYLNVNVWGTCMDGNDILLGYANIPLNHILNECCNSVLGHYIRRYSFLPPTNASPNNQTHPLYSHSGFEHVFCYGDILLSFVWTHEDDVEIKRKASIVSIESEGKSTSSVTTKHDFVRRQFHRTTQCDFCTKKIWLKDAVQCKNCGMCCHKKCIVKCQLVSDCHQSEKLGKPEITMTEADDLNLTASEGKTNFSTGAIKRVNSVNNLSIPASQWSSVQTRSLPPSPQRTPSRKHSLSNSNPFLMCPAVLDEIQREPEDSIEAINRLLEQVLLHPPDEYLMDAAKETGQQFYNHLTYKERSEKINLMMVELKKSLDYITNEHMELSKRLNVEENEVEKTKLAFLLGKADAKVHGLSVLMLHYCSSLQHSPDKII